MCLSSEIVLSVYLYHLKECDRYVCIISKYVSIICKIVCVKNSTTMGHHIHYITASQLVVYRPTLHGV